MSFFRYRGYTHPEHEVNLVRYEVRQIPSPRGLRMDKEIRMFLMGEIIAEGAALLARIAEVIDAYSLDFGDATLFLDASTPTRHTLDNGTSISGVKVIQRSWPVGDGAELAVKRTFSVVLAAIYPDLDSELLEWHESVRFVGNGGPHIEDVMTFNGLKKFQTAPATIQRITQSGYAIGYHAPVLPPGPLLPTLELPDVREAELHSGNQRGQGATHYKTTWIYRMTSGTPQDIQPTTR